jgi:hypothetical protein
MDTTASYYMNMAVVSLIVFIVIVFLYSKFSLLIQR